MLCHLFYSINVSRPIHIRSRVSPWPIDQSDLNQFNFLYPTGPDSTGTWYIIAYMY